MSSLPEGESADGGKAPSTSARRGSAHDLDTDSTQGHTLYRRQRRLRGLVLAILAGAVLLLVMAGIRETVRQVRATPDVPAPTDYSSSPAGQASNAVETPTDQRKEPIPAGSAAVAPSAKASPAPQPRHHRAPPLPRQKRGTYPRPTK